MLYSLEIIAFLIVILIEVQLYLAVRKLAENVKIKSPIKIVKEHKEKREKRERDEKERKRFETLMSNLETYDGTSIGQRKIDE